MTGQPAAIDHVVAYARSNLDAVVKGWRDLGFDLTERGYHSLGTMNNLVMMPGPYLEILGPNPDHDPPVPPETWRRDGISGLAFSTPDIDDAIRRMHDADIQTTPLRSFDRPVDIDGQWHVARFRVCRIDPAQTPGIVLFFCEHQTPELIWRPEWMQHPNQAESISRISLFLEGYVRANQIIATIFRQPAPAPQADGAFLFERNGVSLSLSAARPDGLTGVIGICNSLALPASPREIDAYPSSHWPRQPMKFFWQAPV